MAKNLQTAAAAGPVPELAANAAPPLPGRRPRGRPRKALSELDEGNRRRLIIEGAARLFRAKGFAAASTRDIAAAAGMHGGSPFYHFESKNALLYVVMQEGMTQAAASQQAALGGVPANAPARERLRTLIRNHFQVLLGPGSDFIPVMLYEWRSLNAGQRAGISKLTGAYEAQWMPTLRALHQTGQLAADPGTARLFIFGALNWSVQWFSPQGAQSLDDLTAQALALFTGEA
ncbi:MAG TPA: TetR/AcrR family transcriptional regulator [Rhodoferax sp.]|nr:TetR/AcrR family transcriptional regulator [Rhodoferax sp.]